MLERIHVAWIYDGKKMLAASLLCNKYRQGYIGRIGGQGPQKELLNFRLEKVRNEPILLVNDPLFGEYRGTYVRCLTLNFLERIVVSLYYLKPKHLKVQSLVYLKEKFVADDFKIT